MVELILYSPEMKTLRITSATRQVRQQWFSVGIFPLGLQGDNRVETPKLGVSTETDQIRANNVFLI